MNIKTNLLLAIVILGSFAAAQEIQAAGNKPAFSPIECAVWNRETSFSDGVTSWPSLTKQEQVEALQKSFSKNCKY